MFKTIKAKVFFFVFLLVSGTALLFYLFTTDVMRKHLLKEILQRTELLARSISASASYHFISKDMLGLDHTIFHAKEKHPDIESIALVDKNWNILAHTEIEKNGMRFIKSPGNDVKHTEDLIIRKVENGYEITSPLTFANQNLGYLVLKINDSSILAAEKRMKRNILIIGTVILVFAGAVTIALSTIITRPVNTLIKGIEALRYNEVEGPLPVYSTDELGKLTQHFNELVNTITIQQESIKHYAIKLEESFISTVKSWLQQLMQEILLPWGIPQG